MGRAGALVRDRLAVRNRLDGPDGGPAMGDQAAGRWGGVRERVMGDMVAVGVADDSARPRLPRVEPEVLLRKVDPATVPEDGVGDQRRLLLGRGGGAFEELVAKRARGAEALARRTGEDAGAAAGWTGFLGFAIGAGSRQLDDNRRLDSLRHRFHHDQGIALGGLDDGWRWRLKRWCCCGGGVVA